MFDGEGSQLAGCVGETAPHAARSECCSAFARGVTTGRESRRLPEQRHTDRRGERGSRPQNATLRLTISLQKSKGPSGPVQQRCTEAGDRLDPEKRAKEAPVSNLRERGSRPAVAKVRNHPHDETRKQPVTQTVGCAGDGHLWKRASSSGERKLARGGVRRKTTLRKKHSSMEGSSGRENGALHGAPRKRSTRRIQGSARRWFTNRQRSWGIGEAKGAARWV